MHTIGATIRDRFMFFMLFKFGGERNKFPITFRRQAHYAVTTRRALSFL